MDDLRDHVSRVGDSLVHREGSETLVVEPWGRDGLRVRATVGPEILDTAWALTEAVESRPGELSIVIEPTHAEIRNGTISARVETVWVQKGRLRFFRHEGDRAIPILSEYDYVVPAHNPGTRVFGPVVDGLAPTEVHFAPRPGERLYGMGLNATGSVDLKGSVIDLYQRHVKHVVPFVVSSEGYGFLWNNPSLGRVEFGTDRTRWVSEGCRQIDYYVTAGESYADIMANYADATGHAPDFPEWAAGFWMCKLRYATQEDFLTAAREFVRLGLPVSVLVIDIGHWKHMGDWKLDPEFWPDPRAMVDEMNELGIRIMISPWTLVDEASENFAVMKERGLFTGSTDGQHDAVELWGIPGEPFRQYDPTNPESVEFLWDVWKRNYVDLGIRTFWLDPCDDFHAIQDYGQVQFHIGTGTEVHNYFPVAHQRNVYEGLRAAGENEVVSITRSSWAGSQRYGAAPAPHDIMSTFEHFEAYVKAGLNLGMSGIPWGASEIGGFITLDPEADYFHELMVRWYQYGVFTPVFRTHGGRTNNEPWTIGGDSYRHIRAAIVLRERLKPYVMAQMTLASSDGVPPMRPLFFDHDADPQVWAVEDQFLFGSDLLIAPVTRYEGRSRAVYLPAGTDWVDAWTGDHHSGGQTIHAEAPLERIPVYVRAGTSAVDLSVFVGLAEA
jgi:alpha-D-xyloside xylohydrolase